MKVSSVLMFFLRFYKFSLSPLLPRACRFYPTCSEYAFDAIKKYGAAHGSILAIKRFFRCNPFCKGGYDPVP
ncbi:MAG: membrane protein insertion efficiency factor YidD [Treponemataceae bacterium]